MNRSGKLAALVLAGSLAGCGVGAVDAEDGLGESAEELLIKGSADYSDAACNVVLRTIAASGQDCSTGKCWTAYKGSIDLSKAAAREQKWVGVLYRSSVDNYQTWREAKAVAVAGAPTGMKRYQFTMSQFTFDPGMSGSSIGRTRIEVSALFKNSKGGRMFDHNRIPGAFDNYVLEQANGWALADDPAVCYPKPTTPPAPPARAEVSFTSTGIEQHAALIAGGTLVVQYDPFRLQSCRSTHNGYPGWTIQGTVRFVPGGETFELGMLSHTTPNGQPGGPAVWLASEIKIPAVVSGAEIWFRNSDVSGCVAWDSNNSQNWKFEVLAKAPAVIGWAGGWGNGFNRACEHRDGLAEPTVLDSYVKERACTFVDAEVWAPGLTDLGERPDRVAAQVEYAADGGATKTAWLTYVGRVGNNYRYRWELPRAEMNYVFWNSYAFSFRFSTDGATWYRIGQADGPQGGAARTIQRDASWCASGWEGCN